LTTKKFEIGQHLVKLRQYYIWLGLQRPAAGFFAPPSFGSNSIPVASCGRKIGDFDQYVIINTETVRDDTGYKGTKSNRRSYVTYRTVPFSMTLSEPWLLKPPYSFKCWVAFPTFETSQARDFKFGMHQLIRAGLGACMTNYPLKGAGQSRDLLYFGDRHIFVISNLLCRLNTASILACE